MLRFSILLFLPLLSTVTAQFNPAVNVSCTTAPSYTFTLSGSSDIGVIFVDALCETQDTVADGLYTFDAASCTTPGPIPPLGTTFTVVVQEYITLNMATDLIVNVDCNLDTSSVTKAITIGIEGEEADATQTQTLVPDVSVLIQDVDGNPITSGVVGDLTVIQLTLTDAAIFGHQITTFTAATADDSVDLIVDGCTEFERIIAQPALPTAGLLEISFSLFIPLDTSARPIRPGVASRPVTYTFIIMICESDCTAPTCGDPLRRRRSASSTNSTYMPVELAASLNVYPPGHKSAVTRQIGDEVVVVDDEVCLSRGPLIGLLAGMCIALALCMAISSWMFCRLRSANNKGDVPDFTKHRC